MKMIDFDSSLEFDYHWCGQFVPPSSEWIHMTRDLTDYELMIVTKGTLYISSENEDYSVSEGQYLLMPPTRFQHGWKEGGATFYWMHFSYNKGTNDHSFLEKDYDYTPGHLVFPVQGKPSSLDRIIILLKQLMDSDRRYREVTLNRYLVGAILAEIAASAKTFQNYGRMIKGEQTFADICDYINWHIQDSLKVYEIADYFGYNEKYLTTFFKNHCGISLKQYIINEKTQHAKALLTETSQPVSQIGYSLGFTDSHNFSNAFTHATGLSPTKWRETYNIHNNFNK